MLLSSLISFSTRHFRLFFIYILGLYGLHQWSRTNWQLLIAFVKQGRPSPRSHDAFSPLFQISSPIFEKFSGSVDNLKNVTFSRKISPFSSATLRYISPLFRENYYFPPTLKKCPPVLQKFTFFYILYVYFVFPLIWPYAFMQHPIHVLDAPVVKQAYGLLDSRPNFKMFIIAM